MVPWLRRRRLSVSPLAFAGWARRFRRPRDPRTAVARFVSRRVRRHDVAREYGARAAKESLRLTLIGSGRALLRRGVILTGDTTGQADMRKVIDLECDLRPDESGNPRKLEAATSSWKILYCPVYSGARSSTPERWRIT